MILLTSINGKEFYLNCDLIYKLQESFDTIITLIDGKNIRVKDSPDDIVEKIIEYKRLIHNNSGEGIGHEKEYDAFNRPSGRSSSTTLGNE